MKIEQTASAWIYTQCTNLIENNAIYEVGSREFKDFVSDCQYSVYEAKLKINQ